MEQASRTSPLVDLAAGIFFLLWAGAGWWSYWGNAPLRESLGAGADPGPALLPLITLSILTLGGAIISAAGLYRLAGAESRTRAADLPNWKDHLLPAAFLASLLLLVLFLRQVGFLLLGFLFAAAWLYALSCGRQLSLRAGLACLLLGAFLTIGVYLIFAHLLHVPLPR